jgi:hypothetical protein
MFSGSDEFVLREILENVDHIKDLHKMLVQCRIELEYANYLKEYQLGIIDANEIMNYKQQVEQFRQKG